MSNTMIRRGLPLCLSILTLTLPAQAARNYEEAMRIMGAAGFGPMLGMPMQMQQPMQMQPAQPVMSEEQLDEKLKTLGEPVGVKLIKQRDGFKIDGRRFVDPEGEIVSYGYDVATGDITYMVLISRGNYKIKTTRASSDMEPITIAVAARINGVLQVTTATGRNLSGNKIAPLSRGLIVVREDSAFKYVPGKGVTTISNIPEGWAIADIQSGDIQGTGYLLIQKLPDDPGNDLQKLGSRLKSIGSLMGMGKKEDYALLEIKTGKLVPINVSLENNEAHILSQCHRTRVAMVLDCERMQTVQSAYKQDGSPNLTHYYWRISWYKTPDGPVLIAQESGLSEINAVNLSTGKKTNLFSRGMGIAGYAVQQGADGRISVSAQMGFSRETIDDVVAFMSKAPSEEGNKSAAATDSSAGGEHINELLGF